MLPGAGATIASAITYMTEKKLSGNSDSFGKGDIRGVAAPEAANNASACGSFIPMLTLGVRLRHHGGDDGRADAVQHHPGPGNVYRATGHRLGIDCGTADCQRDAAGDEHPADRSVYPHVDHPAVVLVPAIAAVSAVGVYAVHSTTFDLVLMVGLGVFGYILRKMHFPMSPLILGFVLGEMLEQNLRRALSISNGSMDILWASGVAKVLLAMAVMVIVIPPVLRLIRKRNRKPQVDIG